MGGDDAGRRHPQVARDRAVLEPGGNPWAFVWFQILLAGTDLQLYKDLSTGKASYTDPRVVAVMNTWLDMEQKGYFSDPGQTQPEEQMKSGKLAMIPFGTWYASTLETAGLKNGTDWGIFTIPDVNPARPAPVAIETAPACVAAKSQQKDLGMAYSAWWMTSQAQTAWSKQQGNLPFNPKAQAPTPPMTALKELPTRQVRVLPALLRGDPRPDPERSPRPVHRVHDQPAVTRRRTCRASRPRSDEYWAEQ